MIISSVIFCTSSPDYKRCPAPVLPEFAFIGRSNVGKSSLINMLAGRKSLAKVSGTPGKTRLINHFLVDGSWYLVDLPGIGFAKIPKNERMKLESMIQGYLLNRDNLRMIFLIVDSRHGPQKIDVEFMDWMISKRLPFTLIQTKTDKLSKTELSVKFRHYQSAIKKLFGIEPQIMLTSSSMQTGKKDILDYIGEMLDS